MNYNKKNNFLIKIKTSILLLLVLLTAIPFVILTTNNNSSITQAKNNVTLLNFDTNHFDDTNYAKNSELNNQVESFHPQGYEWVPFIDEAEPGQRIDVLPKSRDTMGLCIDASFYGMYRKSIEVVNTTFDILTIPGASHLTTSGKPALPMVTRFVEIPQIGSDNKNPVMVEAEIIYSDAKELDDYYVYPAQEFPEEFPNATHPEFQYDESFYNMTDFFYPEDIVPLDGHERSSMIFLREHRLLALNLCPVQFNPATRKVRVYSKIEVRLNYDQPAEVDPVSSRTYSPAFEELLDNFVLNYLYSPSQYFSTGASGYRQENDGAEYLIITHDNFYDEILPLAKWKQKKGLTTKVVKTSQIQTGGSLTASDIKDYIQDAYDDWTPTPAYILLVGDSEFIPTNYETTHPSDSHGGFDIASDLHYVTVHGTDYFPDIFIGRLSVDSDDHITTIVNKILKYERNPPVEAGFYNNITAAAFFEDQDVWLGPPWNMWLHRRDGFEDKRFVLTSEEIRDFLVAEGYSVERIYEALNPNLQNPTNYNNGPVWFYDDGDPLPAGLLFPGFAWDGDTADVSDAINDGSFLMYHRDHGGSRNFWHHEDLFWGATEGWSHPEFEVGDIAGLTNGDLLPLVLSVNCQTGWFDGETDQNNDAALTRNFESYCEMFVRQAGGGAIAAIGASRNSRSGYNDYLAKGFIDALWPDFNTTYVGGELFKLGQVLTYGKIHMATIYGYSDDFVQPTFELFHLFGDPEMSLWTDEPKDLTVSHPEAIGSYGTQNFVVSVTSGTAPVHHAKVCLQKEGDVYEVGYTDTNGYAIFEFSPSYGGKINITVTKQNYRPYEGEMEVTDDGGTFSVTPSISYIGHSITLEGNNFGNSETVEIYFGDTTPETTASTNTAGSFSKSHSVPSVDPGALINVIAIGQSSGIVGVDLFKCLLEEKTCDPYTYSQWDSSTWHLNTEGGDPRWNNPDIQLYEKSTMNPVASNNLVAGTTYVIRATIHNNLAVAADNTDVTFEWAFWGAGQKDWHFIDTDTISVPGSGTKIAEADWTPSVTGHNCIKVTIDQYWDEDVDNNVGQENTHVQPVSSPAEITFNLVNPWQMPALIYLEATYLDGESMWPATVQREYPQVLDPGENYTVIIIIEVPDQLDEGMTGHYAVNAYIDGWLIGGIEIEVIKEYKPPPTTTRPPTTTTPTTNDTISSFSISLPIVVTIGSIIVVPVFIIATQRRKKK